MCCDVCVGARGVVVGGCGLGVCGMRCVCARVGWGVRGGVVGCDVVCVHIAGCVCCERFLTATVPHPVHTPGSGGLRPPQPTWWPHPVPPSSGRGTDRGAGLPEEAEGAPLALTPGSPGLGEPDLRQPEAWLSVCQNPWAPFPGLWLC